MFNMYVTKHVCFEYGIGELINYTAMTTEYSLKFVKPSGFFSSLVHWLVLVHSPPRYMLRYILMLIYNNSLLK